MVVVVVVVVVVFVVIMFSLGFLLFLLSFFLFYKTVLVKLFSSALTKKKTLYVHLWDQKLCSRIF